MGNERDTWLCNEGLLSGASDNFFRGLMMAVGIFDVTKSITSLGRWRYRLRHSLFGANGVLTELGEF
jgi:hypothetical protein